MKITPMDTAALSVHVEALDSDVREIKDSILGLDAKIEKAVTDLAREFRSAISSLATQFSERQRTPWGVIFTGAGVLIGVLVTVGGQALAPVQANVKTLQEQIVPREEINYRSAIANQRFEGLTKQIDQMATRRYEEMVREIVRLNAALAAKLP